MKKIIIVLIFSIVGLCLVSCSSNLSSSNNKEGNSTIKESVKQDINISEYVQDSIESTTTEKPTDNNLSAQAESESINLSDTVTEDYIDLKGTIGDLEIHMSIKIYEGEVEGTYFYNKYKTNIQLKGTIEINRMIRITEYGADGSIAGTFDGWYTPGIRIEGSWINENTKEILPFELNIINGISEKSTWSGEWRRINSGRFDPATLVIFNETDKNFDFQIDAFSGGYQGFIGGTASISSLEARFYDIDTGAELLFTLNNGVIVLEQNNEAQFYAGAGVGFSGDFKKGDLNEEFTPLSTGIVKTKEQERELQLLVGEDIALFLDTSQKCCTTENLDDFEAIVEVHWVRGLAGTNESIIMFLPDDKICAAVIQPLNNTVKVYTNAKYIQKVPMSIEKWRERFQDFEVEFINKS